jgi:hypothetical protein
VARRLIRLALAGLACALLVLALGALLRRTLLGADEGAARARVESEIRSAFTSMALELRSMAQQAGDPKDIPLASAGDTSAASRLFTSAAEAVSAGGIPDLAVTLYGAGDQPLAWAGRPTQLPADRLQAAETWFLTPGELDRRLVYVRSVTEGAGRGRGVLLPDPPRSRDDRVAHRKRPNERRPGRPVRRPGAVGRASAHGLGTARRPGAHP